MEHEMVALDKQLRELTTTLQIRENDIQKREVGRDLNLRHFKAQCDLIEA